MLQRLFLFLKGFCMGIADVIPGVSGGTMALVLGVYERLVSAIGSIGVAFFGALFKGAFWKRFFTIFVKPEEEGNEGVDIHAGNAAFLLALVIGILAAVLTGVKIIPVLLEDYREPTHGFFFGLVLASLLVPFRMMQRKSWRELVAFAMTLAATFYLVGQQIDSTSNARGYVMVSAEPGESVRLSATDARFSTHRFEGKAHEKREVLYRPANSEDIILPESGAGVRVEVVAVMAGDDANLGAGELKDLFKPKAKDFRQHGKVRVSQPEPLTGGSNPALWYIFVCGAIAICAMILPGISGSFILLLLGQYFYVLYTVHEIIYGKDFGRLSVLGVFLLGILVGIAAFSRVLKWLLARFPSVIMAVLIGLMLGSLRKLWPFFDTTPDGTENRLPAVFDGTVGVTVATFFAGLAIVLALNWLGQREA